MKLTERHIIKTDEWGIWCEKAKNLYNQALYYWRQSVFGNIQYFTEYELLGLFREYKEDSFTQLPSHCGQEVLKNLFKNIKSWQRARKEYSKNPSKFSGRPKIPKYKKELSRLGVNNGQIKLKNGYIHFPIMIGVAPIKTKIPNESKLGACRIIPKANHFVVEFTYEVKEMSEKGDNGNYLGVDLGLNNLATCSSNIGKSFIINGKVPKSINQWYNKQKAYLQSKLPGKSRSRKIQKITFNRNNKINNYIHHASKYIIKEALKNNINTIIIGNNKQWKTNVNLGRRINQAFVSMPYKTLIEQLEYKAKLVGLKVLTTEESYTSKCSALDLEPICKHEVYVGKRRTRGLFMTKLGHLINADANGALNIIRKKYSLIVSEGVARCVVQPKKIQHFNKMSYNNE